MMKHSFLSGVLFAAWLRMALLGWALCACDGAWAGGALVGGNFLVFAGAGFHSGPAVAFNTRAANFLVAWTSAEPSPADATVTVEKVMARVVSSAGVLETEPVVVSQRFSTDPALGGSNPRIAYNEVDDEFLVIYERGYTGSIEQGIFAQRIGPDGVLRGNEIAVSIVSGQTRPVIAHDPAANRYFVAWNGTGNVFGGLLGGDGVALGPFNQLAPLGQFIRNAAIDYNGDTSQYLLAYETGRADTPDIEARRIDANGFFSGFAIPASTAAGAQTSPEITVAAGGFLVSWVDAGNNAAAQQVNGDGSLDGANVVLTANAASPEVVYSSQRSRYLLTWVAAEPGNANDGFLMGRFLQNGLASQGALFRISETSQVTGAPAMAVYQQESLGLAVWAHPVAGGGSALWGQLIDLSTRLTRLTLVSVAPSAVRAGAELTYVLTITNGSSLAAKGAVLSSTLPEGATLVSVTSSVGRCGQIGLVVDCALGNPAAGTKAKVTIKAALSKLGSNVLKSTLDWSNNPGDPLKSTDTVKVSYPGSLTLIAPDGGEKLQAGTPFDVSWALQGGIPGDVLHYRLQYSLDAGQTWKTAANGLGGSGYRWTVPSPAGNRPKSLVRVIGFNRDNFRIGSARSAKPFSIEVLRVAAPAAGAVVSAGHTLDIAWNTYATKAAVAGVRLRYSLDGGSNWKKLDKLEGNAGSYAWTVPAVTKPSHKALIRVELLARSGSALGSAVSGKFTVLP